MSHDLLSNHSDEVILRHNPYTEYANLSEALKRKLEPALLVEIIGSSNLGLDSKNITVEECSNLLRDDPQVRNLLLGGWKSGTFQLVRESRMYMRAFLQKSVFLKSP
jgi:hypothetical protein